jgi:hypothetical protein
MSTQQTNLNAAGTAALGYVPQRHLQAVADTGPAAAQSTTDGAAEAAEILRAALAEPVWMREIEAARKHFTAATKGHEMTVIVDQAVPDAEGRPGSPHRHLRFATPGTGLWAFDLVTWPGHLAISGDVGSFTFRRLHDMADFFGGAHVNASYWAEKLVAGTAEGSFSSERYVAEIARVLERYRPSHPSCNALDAASYADLQEAVKRDLLDEMPPYVEQAREQLADFVFYYDGASSRRNAFRFHEAWEMDMSGYDHRYLIACHAIQYGINRYRKAFPERVIREVGGSRAA